MVFNFQKALLRGKQWAHWTQNIDAEKLSAPLADNHLRNLAFGGAICGLLLCHLSDRSNEVRGFQNGIFKGNSRLCHYNVILLSYRLCKTLCSSGLGLPPLYQCSGIQFLEISGCWAMLPPAMQPALSITFFSVILFLRYNAEALCCSHDRVIVAVWAHYIFGFEKGLLTS